MGRISSAIPKSLFTTIGDIIAASAVSTPARIAAAASGQVFTAQGAGVLPAWAAASAGALTRVGGNTTEATTTSGSAVDLLAVSSLSLVAGTPVLVVALFRKSAGAADATGLGCKINATVVAANVGVTNAVDQAESGMVLIRFTPNTATYLENGFLETRSSGGGNQVLLDRCLTRTLALPAATVTDIILRGHANSGLTCGHDEMQVYSYATS